jgi:hypothetical protein
LEGRSVFPCAIERSAENIRAVRGAYEIGSFRITELLAEQRRLADYQREYTEVDHIIRTAVSSA